jgi:soluble lytic murein transglycosylase
MLFRVDSSCIIQYKTCVSKRIFPFFLLLVFLLQSCGLQLPYAVTPTPANTSTPTLPPTPTSTPTPSPTPTPIPSVRVDQADFLMLAGDYDKALAEYQTSFTSAQDEATQSAALVGMGHAQLEQGNPSLAIQTLNDEVARFPEDTHSASAYFFLGQAYELMNNHPKALEAYTSYLKMRPGVLDAYIQGLRGDIFAALDDPKSAIDAYQASADAAQLGDPTPTRLKIGQMYVAQGNYQEALRTYLAVYDATSNDYYKAQADLLSGQAYLHMDMPDQAYARYQDAVNNYPRAYDSYTALVALVNASVPVDELNRGLVDYYAGQYGYAIEAFNRYLSDTPEHDDTAHYYKGLSLALLNQPQAAIDEFDSLIKDHPNGKYWASAWDEKAYIQWTDLSLYREAATTLEDFVNKSPDDSEAPSSLYEAARILERDNLLEDAAPVWEQVMEKYPSSDWGYRSLLLAGVTYFRLGKFDQALVDFQRLLVLGADSEEQSSGYFWIGKTQAAMNNSVEAKSAWEKAAELDPTGYYSERAQEILDGQSPFQEQFDLNLNYDLTAERKLAESWMRVTFNLPITTDFSGPGALANDARMQRGTAFWELGLYDQARNEFESLRQDILNDPENNFRLLSQLLRLGFYRSAILCARQILDLAGMDDASTLTAPAYFNHIRFGLYFQDYVNATAQTEGLNPLFLYSVIRQESLFEGFSSSGAGARGVMQIMPATGSEVAKTLGWPDNFTPDDLYRPMVGIRLGARYLDRQRDAFNGDMYAALAGYNGGPGNAQAWLELSGNDPDLFLEIIRIQETRTYIMQIFEFYNIYRLIYAKNP